MKPFIEDIIKLNGHSSFYAYSFKTHHLEFRLHFHPEYELTFVVKGNGYRLIGNHHQEFEENDLVLIGSNLPHTWVGKVEEDKEPFEQIVIQFSKDFIGRFDGLEETKSIFTLLAESKQGIFFKSFKPNLKKILIKLIHSTGIERINNLIYILSLLANEDKIYLSDKAFLYNNNDEFRINKVLTYLQNNYTEKIQLKNVANLIFQSESNFCKFFKKSTGKTFSNYLNDIRINEVCQMLLNTDKTINEIAYNCGFETLSYFNRVFLKKKKVSPLKFRIEHKKFIN